MVARWKGLTEGGRGAVIASVLGMTLAAALVAGFGYFIFESVTTGVSTEEESRIDVRELERQERQAFLAEWEEMERRQDRLAEERREKGHQLNAEAEVAAQKAREAAAKRSKRRVRRWQWKSPDEIRAEIWHVPENEVQEATETALLRICTSEMPGSVNDCVGIWQVIGNIRSRTCDRSYTNLITECDEHGETALSAMRRASRYVVGVAPPKHRRHRWISRLKLDCERPENFPRDQQFWERHHRHDCEQTVRLVRALVAGEQRTITRAPIIAWGGKCEVKGGACDDPLACARGLARVPGLQTGNGFWCRVGARRCRQEADPICVKLGYGEVHKQQKASAQAGDGRDGDPGA